MSWICRGIMGAGAIAYRFDGNDGSCSSAVVALLARCDR